MLAPIMVAAPINILIIYCAYKDIKQWLKEEKDEKREQVIDDELFE